MRRMPHDNIRRGLEWVRAQSRALRHPHRERQLRRRLRGVLPARPALAGGRAVRAREGMLVCAAAGNKGHEPGHPVLPPASAPSVLTVGALDDQNRLAFAAYGLYHSSYGPTVDGLQKPEVVAPGIWVAAPILPGTPTAAQAALLRRLDRAPTASSRPCWRSAPEWIPISTRRGARRPVPARAACARSSATTTSSPETTNMSTAPASRRPSCRRWPRRCWRPTRP